MRGEIVPSRDDVLAEMNRSLFEVVRNYDAFRSAFARAHKMTITEVRALARVFENPSISPKQLATMLDLTTGAVTALVDKLEGNGLVVRAPHQSDRRSQILQLTDSGEALIQQLLEAFLEELRHGTSDLDDEKLVLFGELLSGLVERGRRLPAE
jgi:DNA-binding MarR family transcriptional regulator